MIYTICFFLIWGYITFKRGDSTRLRMTLLFVLLFLGLSQLARIFLYFLYPAIFDTVTWTQLLISMGRGVVYDFSMLCLVGGPVLILLNLPLRSRVYQRIVAVLAIVVLEVYSFLWIADIVYFKYVQKHIGSAIFDFFLSVPLIVKTAIYSYWPVLLVAGVCMSAGIYGAYVYACRLTPVRKGPILYEGLFLFLLGFFLWFGERGYFFCFQAISTQWAYTQQIEQGHLTLNGVFSVVYSLNPSRYILSAKAHHTHPSLQEIGNEESQQVTQELLIMPGEQPDPQYPFQRTRTRFTYAKAPKNIIILALESLDARYIDALSGTQYGATPHLDKLVRQGLSFNRFYSCTDGSSLVGIGALMSGVCKVAGFPYYSRGLEQVNQRGLGDVLRQAGYETVFVRACEDGSMYIGPISRLLGFDSYGTERIRKEYGASAVYDADALHVLAEKMKQSSQPFAGFFFSTATHEPLGMLQPKHFSAELEQKFQGEPYLLALSYTDWSIGQFLDTLHQEGLDKDTVFIVVGDHIRRERPVKGGERFHVPFILAAPGIISAGQTEVVAGQTDVLPTIVDLLHISVPYAAMGKSVLADPHKTWTFVNLSEDDFGFVTPDGLVRADSKSDVHRAMIALNKAVYLALKNNRWAK